MKNSVKSFFVNPSFHKTALLLLLGLAACKNEDVIAPAQQPDIASENLRTSAIPTTPKKHQLVNHGNAMLTYRADGRLDKVTDGARVRGGDPVVTKYRYMGNYIEATKYREGKVDQIIIYTLDPATGFCVSHHQTDYVAIGSTLYPSPAEYVYQYNAKGQLTNRYNKNATDCGTDFAYAANGDLTSVSNYSSGFKNQGKTVGSGATLYYGQEPGDAMLADKYPINIEEAGFPDPYLRIFGKPGKHLVKLATYFKSLDGKVYSYKTDTDGYVRSRDSYQLKGAALIDSKTYNYTLVDLVLSL